MIIENRPPYFQGPLLDFDMGLFWVRNYRFPRPIDPDGGKVDVKFAPNTLNKFVKLDTETFTLTFNPIERS